MEALDQQFFDKVLYNYCSKFLCVERFVPKNDLPKIYFQLYFQKVIRVRGHFFWPNFFSEKAKHPSICPSFSDNVPKT